MITNLLHFCNREQGHPARSRKSLPLDSSFIPRYTHLCKQSTHGVYMPIDTRLAALRAKVSGYGKENQGELLYALAEGAQLLSGCERIRIYLEDLTRGALSCVHATGPMTAELRETSFPIGSTATAVSRVFVTQYPLDFKVGAGKN